MKYAYSILAIITAVFQFTFIGTDSAERDHRQLVFPFDDTTIIAGLGEAMTQIFEVAMSSFGSIIYNKEPECYWELGLPFIKSLKYKMPLRNVQFRSDNPAETRFVGHIEKNNKILGSVTASIVCPYFMDKYWDLAEKALALEMSTDLDSDVEYKKAIGESTFINDRDLHLIYLEHRHRKFILLDPHMVLEQLIKLSEPYEEIQWTIQAKLQTELLTNVFSLFDKDEKEWQIQCKRCDSFESFPRVVAAALNYVHHYGPITISVRPKKREKRKGKDSSKKLNKLKEKEFVAWVKRKRYELQSSSESFPSEPTVRHVIFELPKGGRIIISSLNKAISSIVTIPFKFTEMEPFGKISVFHRSPFFRPKPLPLERQFPQFNCKEKTKGGSDENTECLLS